MKFNVALITSLLFWSFTYGQNEITISGEVSNTKNEPLAGANISLQSLNKGTQTNQDGEYSLTFTSNQNSVELLISHIGYLTKSLVLNISESNQISQNIILDEDISVLDEVNVEGERQRDEVSVIKLKPKSIQALPSAFGDFNTILSTLPGVVSNNELSSSYSVRGGNFDENLVYVNDIPIYRPFLVSNGQQEGLSFINTDLVDDVSFSAGGWQSKYGDKLSSVLNVTYKKPTEQSYRAYISLLGGGASVAGSAFNNRLSYLAGFRHKSSQYLLNTLEVEGQYLPRFSDFQGYINYKLGPESNPDKTTIGLLGAYARNRYFVEPDQQETEFGTFTQSLRLTVAFEGSELLEYDTYQLGTKLTHNFNQRWLTKLILSGVYADEREFTDVEGGYRLCDVDNNIGSSTFNECVVTRGIGTNYDYGRNTLNAQILNVENRHEIEIDSKNTLEFGVGFSHQLLDDELSEYEFIDSAGFVLENEINTLQSENNLESNNITSYVQHSVQLSSKVSATYGVRLNYFDLNDQLLVSPRTQITFQPDWVRDVVFKGAVGYYQQPPFYRELRDFDGNLNRDLKAQSSVHFIVGSDYNFRWWGRPFKLISEAYYKNITDVVPYDVDNVRLRYYANNNARAFATGLDLRLSGEFIADTQSWFSLSLMSIREDVEGDDRGYIRRPTDQMINLGIFFQDHLPNNPTFRVNLSLNFGSGLPFGPPNDFDNRNEFNGESYRRVDVGFSKQIFLNAERYNNERWLLITAEVLNLLGADNPISFNWVEDVNNTQIAVPNSLSARFLNIKLSVKI